MKSKGTFLSVYTALTTEVLKCFTTGSVFLNFHITSKIEKRFFYNSHFFRRLSKQNINRLQNLH